MPQMIRFSLSYDAPEDRIAWDAEDAAGVTIRLWLTQRFCRDFVGALAPRLPRPTADLPPEHEATAQAWEQAAAMASFGSAPGVTVQPDATAGLVRTVHIAPTPQNVALVFESGVAEPAAITLDSAALRQMLAVLFSLHKAAAWPTSFWPGWIAEPAPAEAAAAALN
ncbi:MAG TPA: hypothetical protein VHW60_11505 [Caulobacteraceae bacterium]|jgi:hypothetical protein|nr:hypothetical protein [Caulobacteraceae bacterium]